MEPLVNKIHQFLLKNKKTLSVAESCTGGLLSNFLTSLPGSSRYFILGVVAYSNKTKKTLLRIPPALLAKKGAVSPEVALKLAQNVRKLAKTDFGIGLSGIAGPSGGTWQKPVGTCFIAVSGRNKNICQRYHFTGSRGTIRRKSALKALELLDENFYRH